VVGFGVSGGCGWLTCSSGLRQQEKGATQRILGKEKKFKIFAELSLSSDGAGEVASAVAWKNGGQP